MSDTPGIDIVEYSEDLAEELAKMYNSWDELWPGGYTQGVPYTAERVRKQFGKMSAIAILIALDAESGKPLGSCTLHQHWRDNDAAYVGTLGVSPEALNKKIGKRLLLRSIEITRNQGYQRMDLGTWAGNMRAVPLYKKIGLMWNPERNGVQMEDYIPAVMEHPFSKPFFEKIDEPDGWYNAHVREIEQAPDDYTVGGMKVYPYSFRKGDDELHGTVDRYGRCLTGIERTIDGKQLRINARLDDHEVLCGVPTKYYIEIENNQGEDVEVRVSLKGPKFLHFDSPSQEKFVLKNGDRRDLVFEFHLDESAPIHQLEIKSPQVCAEIEVDGQLGVLCTGMVVRPIADIRQRFGIARITPLGITQIPLTIIGSSKRKLKGQLNIETPNPDIQVKLPNGKIEIPPAGLAGMVIDVVTKSRIEPGSYDLWANLELEIQNGDSQKSKVKTRNFRIPVFCTENNEVAVSFDDREDRVLIASDAFKATFDHEGGILRIRESPDTELGSDILRTEVGPPFGMTPFRFARRESKIEYSEDHITVTMEAQHPDRPLLIEDKAIFTHRSNMILYESWMTNTSDEEHHCQVRIMGSGGGISISPGTKWIPLKSGVFKAPFGHGLFNYPSIPPNADIYKEGWLAKTGISGVRGQLWDLDEIEEIRIGMTQFMTLQYKPIVLKPGEKRKVASVWTILCMGGWSDIQEKYYQIIKNRTGASIVMTEPKDAFSIFDVENPAFIINQDDPEKIHLKLRKGISAPIPVLVNIDAPLGWSVNPTVVENHMFEDGEEIEIEVKADDKIVEGPLASEGIVKLTVGSQIQKSFTLVKLGKEKGTVDVKETERDGLRIFRVKNDVCEFEVSPDFGGCIISLKNKQGTELLVSSFPEQKPKPGGFMDNYFGGVQPVVWDNEMDEGLDKAQTNREIMDAKIVEDGLWKGVEISWTGHIQKTTRGIPLALQYLTTPGSRVIRVRWIINNVTTAPVKMYPSLFLDPAFDGDTSDLMLRVNWEGRETDVKPEQFPVVPMADGNYIWVRKGVSDVDAQGFALITSEGVAKALGLTISSFILIGMIEHMTYLMPDETKTIENLLLIDPKGVSEIKAVQKVIDNL